VVTVWALVPARIVVVITTLVITMNGPVVVGRAMAITVIIIPGGWKSGSNGG